MHDTHTSPTQRNVLESIKLFQPYVISQSDASPIICDRLDLSAVTVDLTESGAEADLISRPNVE
jgi:hypothetical protein